MRVSLVIGLLLLAGGCTSKTSAGTEDWLRALSLDADEAIFIDRNSIKRDGAIVSLRTLEVARPAKDETCCAAAWVGRSFNCDAETVRRTYRQDAVMAKTDGQRRTIQEAWMAPASGSTAATLYKGYCEKGQTTMFDGPPAVASRDIAIATAAALWQDPNWDRP